MADLLTGPAVAGTILVLGTGGTIAQRGAGPAEIPVAALLPAGFSRPIVTRQIAQRTSVDLLPSDLARLVVAVGGAMRDPAVSGVIVTHGTDTMEETAFLLGQTVAPAKPVVLTGAMRTASHPDHDGPANLRLALDALPRLSPGVYAAFGGALFWGADIAKRHACAPDAMASPNLGFLPSGDPLATLPPLPLPAVWPRIAIAPVWLGIGAEDWAAFTPGALDGLVIAGTGAGNIPAALHSVVHALTGAGLPVLRASRTGAGPVRRGGEMDDDALGTLPAGWLAPAKARLLLALCRAAGFDRAGIAARLAQVNAAFDALGAGRHI